MDKNDNFEMINNDQSEQLDNNTIVTPVKPVDNTVESVEMPNNELTENGQVETLELLDVNPEIIDIDENNKKPEIVTEQVLTEQAKEKKESKAGMTLVIVILLILILVVLFLPQISELLS